MGATDTRTLFVSLLELVYVLLLVLQSFVSMVSFEPIVSTQILHLKDNIFIKE